MSELIVQAKAGALQGGREPGLRRWLGIPYARAARFAAPEPVAPWQGVRPAIAFGRQCSQQGRGKPSRATIDSADHGEDCLHLNVWTPDGGTAGAKPVLVWIHGGAFMAGSANPYDGAALAREGDIVVVTINYRLGVLGFVNFGDALGLPDIPSNLGLRDQIAALEWVRDNIAGFGGDPGRVTICGQSAGSLSVSLLMLAPAARGLFHGAVAQSGAISLIHDHARSIQDAHGFVDALGLDRGGMERLRGLDIADLIAAQGRLNEAIYNGIPAAPWYDGDLLPASMEAARSAPTAPVPLLAGATRDEIRLFDLMPGHMLPSKRRDVEALLFAQLPEAQARAILATYPDTRHGRIALASDLSFGMPTRTFAERHAAGQPTWFYRFDYAHPIVGAAHGLDLTLFWPFRGFKMALARGGPDSGRRAALGRRMRAHVAHFVRHGTPGEDWPRYEATRRAVRVYGLEDRLEHDPQAARFAAWAGRDVTPGGVRPG